VGLVVSFPPMGQLFVEPKRAIAAFCSGISGESEKRDTFLRYISREGIAREFYKCKEFSIGFLV